MRDNAPMIALAKSRGFRIGRAGERDAVEFALELDLAAAKA